MSDGLFPWLRIYEEDAGMYRKDVEHFRQKPGMRRSPTAHRRGRFTSGTSARRSAGVSKDECCTGAMNADHFGRGTTIMSLP
jgi:hypothetical protein